MVVRERARRHDRMVRWSVWMASKGGLNVGDGPYAADMTSFAVRLAHGRPSMNAACCAQPSWSLI
jgi:hypothetical protein